MRFDDEVGKGKKQSREISINGVSLVFYSIRMLDKPLKQESLEFLGKREEFRQIRAENGYVENVFKFIDPDRIEENRIFIYDKTTQLPKIELSNNDIVTPLMTHYICIYAKSVVLVQSVLMFDRNNITNYPNVTHIDREITIDDLLTIISKIKNKEKKYYSYLEKCENQAIDLFLSELNENDKIISNYSPKDFKDIIDMLLSVQIWDVSNVELSVENKNLNRSLLECYEVELATILSCHNKHIVGSWRSNIADLKTEWDKIKTLNDQQVIINENVCIEISQVNIPEYTDISAERLLQYGYDSTSIFLWSYMVMVKLIYNISREQVVSLYRRINRCDNNLIDIETIVNEEILISMQLDIYGDLEFDCIKKRHRDFIREILKRNDLEDEIKKIRELLQKIRNKSTEKYNANTSQTSSQIKKMLKEQSKASGRLSMLSLILSFSAVIPVTEFFLQVWPHLQKHRLRTLSGVAVVLLVTTWLILFLSSVRSSRIEEQNTGRNEESREESGEESIAQTNV
ncbi:hypothetical protein R9X47_28640 [Wukongibacter baidiensis]|uniref:hypothetical protein n=1 Tax=Wukongibacter baidiensis TaxID=1723361 RepID=UPI003D7F7D1A